MIRKNVLAALSLALTVAISAPILCAALPVVERLSPMGVVRGEETTITFTGSRLGDAHQVLVDLPGIEVLEVTPAKDGKSVAVKLKSDADLSPGLYPLRLVTKSGIANLRLLGVGAMPIAKEVEPNNDFATPQKIDMNHTIEGVVNREDIDHYQVALKAGDILNVEIEGIRLAFSLRNQNILDPYIAILDEGRFEVATSDDSALLQQDGFCSYTAPKDGNYTILVRDSSFLGNPICGYRLHVGSFPRPVGVMPAGGVPGAKVESKLINADNQLIDSSVQLPTEPTDRWPFIAKNEHGISPSPNWMRVNDLPVVMEAEPNNDYRKAPEHAVPAAFCGTVGEPGDYDCFSFQAKKGQRYRVEVFARNVLRSPLDGFVHVFGPDNKSLVSNDDNAGAPDPYSEFDIKADGKHTVRIYDQLRGGSAQHTYRIEVTMPVPNIELTLKQLRRDEAQVVSVPVGGQTALMVTAKRNRYNGEIRMELDGLPEGVTATPFPIPSGRGEIPVLLTAAPDAKHNASLFTINARGDEKNFNVMGTLSQRHSLVLGQNRRPMWGYSTKRAAMAVTDAAPFKIELVQPKTPIVRNGSKELLVKIVRNEGFEGQVALRTLYNPPGIGVNNSRKIVKDKNEALIPITANKGAAIGKWPLIMLATYSTPLGSAQIVTKPIMLDIQNSIFKYEFPKSAGETGSEASVAVKMEILREYEGEAEVELVGLPKGITSPAATQKIAKGAESVIFPILIADDAKVGKHKTLVCLSRIKVGDETIVQTTGTGELRVDKPLPPKKNAPKVEKKAASPRSPQPRNRSAA